MAVETGTIFTVYNEVNTVYNGFLEMIQSSMPHIITAVYTIAVAFVAWKWYIKLAEMSQDVGGKSKAMIYEFMYGILYCILVAKSSDLMRLIENVMNDLAIIINQNLNLPESSLNIYMAEDEVDAPIAEMIPSLLASLVKLIIVPFIVVVDYGVFLARALGLIVCQMMLPVVLALAVIGNVRTQVIKFIKAYAAIFLSGPFYLVVLAFISYAIPKLAEEGLGTMDLLTFLIIITAKVKMYNKVDHTLDKLLN